MSGLVSPANTKEGHMKLLQILLGVVLIAQFIGCVYEEDGHRHYGWHRHHDAVLNVQVR